MTPLDWLGLVAFVVLGYALRAGLRAATERLRPR